MVFYQVKRNTLFTLINQNNYTHLLESFTNTPIQFSLFALNLFEISIKLHCLKQMLNAPSLDQIEIVSLLSETSLFRLRQRLQVTKNKMKY